MADFAARPGMSILRGKGLEHEKAYLAASIILQVSLALFLGHAYDTRIFMATGYLAGTGQNPYIAQDLSRVFRDGTFQGITTIGYPPPWALVLGLIYLCSYAQIQNFLLYNLAIKIPIIAANICLAYLVRRLLRVEFGSSEKIVDKAWFFILFNPFILLTSSAWGQFDPVIALLALLALYYLNKGRMISPAIMLALAISMKPTALPLVPVVLIFIAGKSIKKKAGFAGIFTLALLLFSVAPFFLFHWDPSPILKNWNNQFTVGGGLSFMTFLEYIQWSYLLPQKMWFLGWIWLPVLGILWLCLRSRKIDLKGLVKYGLVFMLVFFLSRAWVSETNINLIVPFVVILVSSGGLKQIFLLWVWLIPLLFSIFNTSLAQLLYPSMANLMNQLLAFANDQMTIRYILRTMVVAAWLIVGWWMVWSCLRTHQPYELERSLMRKDHSL